ncbi:MAG: nickel-dependent lactate racemase [Candidatus Bathyarchaeia archaeon]|jgi:nickel-dependent lactate racemase
MQVALPYGKNQVSFAIDDHRVLDLLQPSVAIPAPDPEAEIERALNDTIQGPTIEALHPKRKRIGVVVDDTTRVTPTRSLLSVILRRLEGAGAAPDMIKVFIALGTHRKMTEDEISEKYGDELAERYEIVNHDSGDESRLKYFGTIADDLPVWINKEFSECDVRIATGNVIPHFNAGWGAGAKTLLPGLAGDETVGRMHVLSALTTPNGLGMDQNPTRELIEAFADKVGLHLVVNTVLNRDRKIVRVFAGHFVKAHRAGVNLARRIYSVKARALTDITIVSSYPADIEFWQGLKGLFSADLCTKPGGSIIELTPCPEGIAVKHPKWINYLELGTDDLKELCRKRKDEDFVALGLALNVAAIRERHQIGLITDGISDRDAERMHFKKFRSVEDGLTHFSRTHGQQSLVNVLKYGGETYPIVER